jgi:hypothetical protein
VLFFFLVFVVLGAVLVAFTRVLAMYQIYHK